MKIIIYDTVGPPYDLSKPLGGAAVDPWLLSNELIARGHEVAILREHPTQPVDCDALIVNRYTPIIGPFRARKTVVYAHEFADGRHDIHRGREFVCVSNHQAESFKRLSDKITVIPPMLGRHVKRREWPAPRPEAWIYASAEDKGLEDSLAAWKHNPPAPGAQLFVMTRDYDDQAKVRYMCAGIANVLEPCSPQDQVAVMSMCHGLWYWERAAEAFPVTLAIARELGLEIVHVHVGHSRCGVDEALTADMRPEVVAARWEEVLRG